MLFLLNLTRTYAVSLPSHQWSRDSRPQKDHRSQVDELVKEYSERIYNPWFLPINDEGSLSQIVSMGMK